MNIPWKLKSRAFRILSYMPSNVLYFVQRNVTRRSRVNITEIHVGWKFHAEVAHEHKAKSLIEFGAGKTLAQNIYLSTFVERQVVVDLFPMAELEMINQAILQLKALGADISGKPVNSFSDIKELYGIEYRAPYDLKKSDFSDGYFDLCVSTNTLEHIPKSDIEGIFSEVRRILNPKGIVSAMIDYSDHYSHSDGSLSRLNYLQYSDQDWEKYNHSNHYQSRMRHQHYKDIFTDRGFNPIYENPTDVCSPDGLNLLPELMTGNETDYSTTGFWKLAVTNPAD